MPGLTPLNLGGSKSSTNSKPVSSIGRIQNERSKPTSSIARSMSGDGSIAHTTSVFRQGASAKATSSIARATRASNPGPTTSVRSHAKRSVFDTGEAKKENSEDVNQRRYDQMMRKKAGKNKKKGLFSSFL